jgi:hypothetical protein
VPHLPLIGHVLSLVIASSLSAHVRATVPAANALQREDRGDNHAATSMNAATSAKVGAIAIVLSRSTSRSGARATG